MTIQIEYDEHLVEAAMRASGAATPGEAIDAALRFYCGRPVPLVPTAEELFGAIEFWPGYDPKEAGRNVHVGDESEPS